MCGGVCRDRDRDRRAGRQAGRQTKWRDFIPLKGFVLKKSSNSHNPNSFDRYFDPTIRTLILDICEFLKLWILKHTGIVVKPWSLTPVKGIKLCQDAVGGRARGRKRGWQWSRASTDGHRKAPGFASLWLLTSSGSLMKIHFSSTHDVVRSVCMEQPTEVLSKSYHKSRDSPAFLQYKSLRRQ